MAKRGYRGKHPYNDTKVSPKNPSSNKYSSKLTTEYNKLKTKLKYDYIRTHYFYPQATATVVCHADIAEDEVITLISTDGTSVTYTAKDATTDTSANEFKSDGNATVTATQLGLCISNASGHNGKILVTDSGDGTLTLTQAEPGPDGNTTIVETFNSNATVPAAFTNG